VVGDPPGRCKLLPEKVVDDPARLRESVRGLLALDFDALLVSDGEPIPQFAKQRLRELVDTFLSEDGRSSKVKFQRHNTNFLSIRRMKLD